jgi:polyhydroxybutyrate depolymerase
MIERLGYYGLLNLADDQAIFVAGEGLSYSNGDSEGLGWGNENGKDVAFYTAMRDRFRSELCVDESRIFSTGFSFGAMFSFTLGCTSDSMTRAIAPMAGSGFGGGCATGTPMVAVLAFIGTEDSLLDGHRQAVNNFVSRDGCTTDTAPMAPDWCDGLKASNLPCTCVSYQGCAAGYPVTACEYTAGHQIAPNTNVIWNFFAQF